MNERQGSTSVLNRLGRVRWGRIAATTFTVLIPVGLALVAAVLVFNYLLMPGFVHHGEEVEIPDLRDRSLAQAELVLADLELAVRDTVGRASRLVPAGHIIDQSPRPGSTTKRERGVHMVVSLGSQRRNVPSVTGQTLRFARLALSQEGYQLGDVLRIPSSAVARNMVVASDPSPGEVLTPGESVSLLVSDGPEASSWIMPDLRGEELRLTADKLRFAGFTVMMNRADAGAFSLRRVRTTFPPPGWQVSRSDTLWLFGE